MGQRALALFERLADASIFRCREAKISGRVAVRWGGRDGGTTGSARALKVALLGII